MKPKEELMVKKSNKLVEARYNWNINEQRIVLLMACDVENLQGPNKNIWTCRVSELEEIFGSEKLTPAYLKNLCDSIWKKRFEMQDERGNWEMNQVLQSAKYADGVITLVATDWIKPQLVELEGLYTQYQLKEIIQFQSHYSIRIYELLRSNNFKSNVLHIRLQELRLKIGVEEGKYSRFSNFEARVLKPAIDEINEKSNLSVSYEKVRSGRRIHEIRFTYQVARMKKILEQELTEKEKEDLLFLNQYITNISNPLLAGFLKEYTVEEILRKYYIMVTQFTFVGNKEGFLRSALEEDYQTGREISYEEILETLEMGNKGNENNNKK